MKIKKTFYRKCFCVFLYLMIAAAIIALGGLVIYLFDISAVDGSKPWYGVSFVVCVLLIVESLPIAALYKRMTPQKTENRELNTDVYATPENKNNFGAWHWCIKCHGRGKLPKKHVEKRFPKNMDALLPNVAEWVVRNSSVSTKDVSEYFSLGYTRTALILDQLASIGILGEKYGPKSSRRVLIGAAKLSLMKEDGYLGIDFLRSDLYEIPCPCCKGEGKVWGSQSKKTRRFEIRQRQFRSMSEAFHQISGEDDENFYGESPENKCYNRLEDKITSMEKQVERKNRELLQSVNGNGGCLYFIGLFCFFSLLNQCSWNDDAKDDLNTLEKKIEAVNVSLDRIQYKVEQVQTQVKLNNAILKEHKKAKEIKPKRKKRR